MIDKTKTILVVDDMPSLRKIVMRALKGDGFEHFAEANDGNEAYQVLQTAKPEVGLIISDWNMPNCSGLDFLRLVRKDPKFVKLQFLMVTSEAEKGQILEAIKAGVTGYILKPFTAESLCQRVKALV